jgi:NADH-quinone oxidoreductase subunit C
VTTSPSELAERVAGMVGSDSWSDDHGTAKVIVDAAGWVAAHEALKDEMPYFSWLSAIDWTTEVAVGDPPDSDDVEERFEVLSCLGDASTGAFVVLSTTIGKDEPVLDTLSTVYGGADWHEREAAEMFGIDFTGHPNLVKLYLPDAFEGYPLRKTFPLLSREVKPWPGTVDVEDMPEGASTENPEDAG